MNLPQDVVDAVMEDWQTADIPEDLRAVLRVVEAMTKQPADIDAVFLKPTRGLVDDARIEETAGVAFHFNFINRLADAFDFTVPDAKQKRKMAAILNFAGKRVPAPRLDPTWVQGEGGVCRPVEIEAGRERMLTTSGVTTPELRRGVEAFVVGQWGVVRADAPDVPVALHPYLTKLALHAYRIVDEDVDALRLAGWTDEQIYEISVVGSLAAGLVGLEAVHGALHGQG